MNKELARKALFTPCRSKEELDRWIRVFLQIRFPDKIVSEESNSSPLEMIWQLYDHAIRNDTEGWKRVMFYANRFGGKCVEKGTLLRTKNGLKKIEDVKIGEIIWSGWAWRPVTDWIHDGVKDSVTVELEYGQRLTGSEQHRIWAWEPGKTPDWKYIKDLNSEDLVSIDTTAPLGNINQDEYCEGYILGVLQGDGCTRFMDNGHITLSTAHKEILSLWQDFCFKNIGRFPKQSKTRPYDYRINSKQLMKLFSDMGLTPCYSWEKTVPDYVLVSKSRSLGFLAGIVDTDGTVSKTGKLQIHMTATKMLEQLQIVLSGLGINSQLIRKNHLIGKQKHIVWKLNCSTSETLKLSKFLMCLTKKMERATTTSFSQTGIPKRQLSLLMDKLGAKGGRYKGYTVRKPSIANKYPVVSNNKIKQLIAFGKQTAQLSEDEVLAWKNILQSNWHFVKNVSLGQADFYDLTVDVDHSYWSNGFVSHNTLAAAVLETAMVLHTGRNIIHMAAIKDQSKKAQEYVKGFFYRPFLSDFVVGDNDTEVIVVSYTHKETDIPITDKEYSKLSSEEQDKYKRKENYIRIIVCTMQSTNGQHAEAIFLDEIDVIPKGNLRAYDQAKNGVPTDRGDLEAMTILTSTRKSRVGKVQQEIDAAEKNGLRVNHWNIIDITEPCQKERHKPDEPKVQLWINDGDVSHISDSQYEQIPDTDKPKYYPREGYAGCAKCPLFAACKGKLATEQSGKVGDFDKGGTALLLKIPSVIDKFKAATPEFITTEFMCRSADTSGLVYPRYNPAIHKKSPQQIAEMIEGGPVTGVTDKASLIKFLAMKGATFAAGMDWGYTHLFATVVFAVWGNWAFVVDAIGLPKQELDDKLALCEHLKELNVSIYADPEDAGSVVTFKRKGFRMKEWSKNAGSVKAGIDIVRTKLYSKALGATLFFMSGDPVIDELCLHIRDYHYTTGTDGKFTEVPDDTNDDLPDAIRYGIMNVFGKNGGLKNPNLGLALVPNVVIEHWRKTAETKNANAMKSIVSSLTNGQSSSPEMDTSSTPREGKKGGFSWKW